MHPLELFGGERAAAPLFEPAGEGGEVVGTELEPRRRGVAAEGDQSFRAVFESFVQIESGNRPRRALRDRLAQRDDHGRPMKRFRQAAGDDADDARVPALPPQHDRSPVAQATVGLEHLPRLVKDLSLHFLAPLVAAVEQQRDLVGTCRVVRL